MNVCLLIKRMVTNLELARVTSSFGFNMIRSHYAPNLQIETATSSTLKDNPSFSSSNSILMYTLCVFFGAVLEMYSSNFNLYRKHLESLLRGCDSVGLWWGQCPLHFNKLSDNYQIMQLVTRKYFE